MRREATVRLAVAIGIYTYKDRPSCYPSQASLMLAAGIATDEAFRCARRELIDLGLLKYQASAGGHVRGGKARTSRYEWVDPQKIRPEDRDSTPPLGRGVAKGGVEAVYPPAPQLSTPPFDGCLPPRSTVGGRCLEDATTKMLDVAASADAASSSAAVEFLTAWNALHGQAPMIAKCRDVKGARGRLLAVRLREPEWRKDWAEALRRIADCPFLVGKNERGWTANVDWFLKPGSVRAILEGKYDNNGAKRAAGWADPLAHIDFGKKRVSP